MSFLSIRKPFYQQHCWNLMEYPIAAMKVTKNSPYCQKMQLRLLYFAGLVLHAKCSLKMSLIFPERSSGQKCILLELWIFVKLSNNLCYNTSLSSVPFIFLSCGDIVMVAPPFLLMHSCTETRSKWRVAWCTSSNSQGQQEKNRSQLQVPPFFSPFQAALILMVADIVNSCE